MLSRVANELYWTGRHVERAENTARLLDVTYRTSLLPYHVGDSATAWAAPWAVPMITMGLATSYYAKYPVQSAENVLRFMAFDGANPSSIFCCLRAARESARSVRGAITSEMYEDINAAWLEMRTYDYDRVQRIGVQEFCDWVKMRSHLFRGITFGTMLRDEAYRFLRLGTHLERADNTARILDTKYHLLLPSAQDVGGAVDYYQWQSLLTSVSGFEAYRKIYSDVITPSCIATCHIPTATDGSKDYGEYDTATKAAVMVGKTSLYGQGTLKIVEPNKLDNSVLFMKVLGKAKTPSNKNIGGQMPLGAAALTAAQKKTLKDWICSGAPTM